MFGIGMQELLIILVLALIFIGPKRLPEIAQALGKGFAEFRKATQEFKSNLDIDNDVSQVKSAFRDMQDEVKGAVSGIKGGPKTWAEPSSGARAAGSDPESAKASEAAEEPDDLRETEADPGHASAKEPPASKDPLEP